MVPKEYSCLAYWQQRFKALEPSLTYKAANYMEHQSWQRKFRKKFVECLGKMPTNDLPLDLQVV